MEHTGGMLNPGQERFLEETTSKLGPWSMTRVSQVPTGGKGETQSDRRAAGSSIHPTRGQAQKAHGRSQGSVWTPRAVGKARASKGRQGGGGGLAKTYCEQRGILGVFRHKATMSQQLLCDGLVKPLGVSRERARLPLRLRAAVLPASPRQREE